MNTIENNPQPNPRGFTRGLGFSLLAIAVAIVIWFNNRMGGEETHSEQSSSVHISAPEPSKNASTPSDPANTNSADLPPGCITAHITQASFDNADHPLDPLLEIANLAIAEIDEHVTGYTATMTSRVFADEKLQNERQMLCKIRHQHQPENDESIPFSVYTRFVKPASHVGQEVIYVEGRNDGKLIGHLGGLLNLKRGYLDPDGPRAMEGNRYPITDIGVRNLVVKMKDFGLRDREHDECFVKMTRDVQLNDRTCTLIEVVHPQSRPHFDFHLARIFIDDERNFPIGYEGYSWPEKKSISTSAESADAIFSQINIETLPLLERYYYTDIQLNPGLTDTDFDPANPEYDFPAW